MSRTSWHIQVICPEFIFVTNEHHVHCKASKGSLANESSCLIAWLVLPVEVCTNNAAFFARKHCLVIIPIVVYVFSPVQPGHDTNSI